jgi:YebC/PmpR family DNA-binding regulatory protein
MVVEGYGPGGVAILVEAVTDNRNRASAELRNIFSKHAGNLAGAGSVSWQFQKKGSILISTKLIDEERLMNLVLEGGAEDMSRDGELFTVTTSMQDLERVKHTLTTNQLAWESSDLAMIPSSSVRVEAPSVAKQLLALLDALEDHEDVQHVWANFDIPDAILAEHAAV